MTPPDAPTDPGLSPAAHARPPRASWKVVVAIAFVAVLAAAPFLPAGWRTLTHFTGVGDGGMGELGYVTVASCEKQAMAVTWTCRGRFAVNDPMAEPYPAMADVTIVNDVRRHRTGEQVDVTKSRTSAQAYLWGGKQQLFVAALWAGVALCLFSAALAVRRRRRGSTTAFALVGVGVALLLVGTWPPT